MRCEWDFCLTIFVSVFELYSCDLLDLVLGASEEEMLEDLLNKYIADDGANERLTLVVCEKKVLPSTCTRRTARRNASDYLDSLLLHTFQSWPQARLIHNLEAEMFFGKVFDLVHHLPHSVADLGVAADVCGLLEVLEQCCSVVTVLFEKLSCSEVWFGGPLFFTCWDLAGMRGEWYCEVRGL